MRYFTFPLSGMRKEAVSFVEAAVGLGTAGILAGMGLPIYQAYRENKRFENLGLGDVHKKYQAMANDPKVREDIRNYHKSRPYFNPIQTRENLRNKWRSMSDTDFSNYFNQERANHIKLINARKKKGLPLFQMNSDLLTEAKNRGIKF